MVAVPDWVSQNQIIKMEGPLPDDMVSVRCAQVKEALSEVYARIDAMSPRIVKETSFRPTENLTWIAAGVALLIALGGLGILVLQTRRKAT